MERRGLRLLACLCASLVLTLALGMPAAAEETVYQMAVNDRFVGTRISASTMPFRSEGVLYIPYTVFDQNVTGVRLGVGCSMVHNSADYYLTLYRIGNTLKFDLNAGTCVEQNTGEMLNMKAISRNGVIFVPLGGVCGYFGLTSSYTPTSYGTLIRITDGKETYTTQKFIEIATTTGRLQERYSEYVRAQTSPAPASPSPSASTLPAPASPEPSGGENRPDRQGVRLYLAFRCTDGGGLEHTLDTLEQYGEQALFFFRPEELDERDGALRRIVGSGHAVGLLVSGSDPAEMEAALERGNALLERIVRLRTHTVLLEEAAAETQEVLEQSGWACWTGNVDGLPNGRGQTALSNAVLAAAEDRRGPVRITMDDSATAAGALSRMLPQLRREGYSIRLAVETEL